MWAQSRGARCRKGLSGSNEGSCPSSPLLSSLFFFKLLDDQPVLFLLCSLESTAVGLPLMLPVAQELFFSSLSLCPALSSSYLCQSKGWARLGQK